MDYSEINAILKKRTEDREVALKYERQKLLAELIKLSITSLHAEYDGYGDSGDIEDIGTDTNVDFPHNIESRLRDFFWSAAYNVYPGFEDNEGALGTITWDLIKNQINIEHGTRTINTHWESQEDI